jgi:two-component system, chemotaxis family, protein-glutamate methylesterase/glutaminase
MIKVVIVEDSPVAREFLIYLLTSDPSIQVVGVANNGLEALEVVKEKKPDVITMDIHMPVMDGFEATRRIMETVPTPIVIVTSSFKTEERNSTFKAIEAGALAIVKRPPGFDRREFDAATKDLIQTVKLMSEVKVVKRFNRSGNKMSSFPVPVTPSWEELPEIKLIAIGASTGGPMALRELLSKLPQDLQVPIMIVQHITSGFTDSFGEWLSNETHFPVHIASHKKPPMPGHVYLAPDDLHMGLGKDREIILSDEAPENGLRPSVAYLFRSVGEVMGSSAIGIILTGMGRDGAEELKIMKNMGAVTIAQDEPSSVVFGMPAEAVRLDAVSYILPPQEIAKILVTLIKKTHGGL